jgi:signal transduction histidine kinase/Tfp pilus assembly protein PilF
MYHRLLYSCLLISLIGLLSGILSAQTHRADSLRALLQQSVHDTVRIKTLLKLGSALQRIDGKQADGYIREAIALAERSRFKHGLALAYRRLGNLMRVESRYFEGLKANQLALQLYSELNDLEGKASVLSNTGEIYEGQGNYARALEFYFRAFDIDQKLGDSSGAAVTINNIGIIYERQGNIQEALTWYLRALPLYERHRKGSVVIILGDIGVAYRKLRLYSEAKLYLEREKIIAVEEQEYGSQAHALLNLGMIESDLGSHTAATSLFQESLNAAQQGNRPRLLTESLLELGKVYLATKKYPDALLNTQRALDTAEQYGLKAHIRDAAQSLAIIYHKSGNDKKAFELQLLFIRYKDSVDTEEANRKLVSYEFDVKLKEQQTENEVLRQEQSAQRTMTIVVACGFAVSSMLLFFAVRSDFRRKRAYQELSEQKKLVDSQAFTIESANQELQNINQALIRQQDMLETQAQEIELANSALQEKNNALESLNMEKNEFLGIVSHDLKNPISAIILSVSMVKRYVERMDIQEIISQMMTIEKTASYMLRTLIQLLDVQILEEGKITAHNVLVDISATILSVVEEYYFRAEQKNISFVCDVSAEHIQIQCDNALLWRVLDNLISNSVKYSPQGKTIFVRLQSSDKAVRFEIQDEGPGITSEDKTKLFGKFARLSAQPTGGEHSTGLGLSIVKKMVEAMNGRVWCESEVGKGATFIVELPVSSP